MLVYIPGELEAFRPSVTNYESLDFPLSFKAPVYIQPIGSYFKTEIFFLSTPHDLMVASQSLPIPCFLFHSNVSLKC